MVGDFGMKALPLHEIRRFPVTVEANQGTPVHESCLRAYQILQKVKEYLRMRVPEDVILDLVAEMELSDEDVKLYYRSK